MTFLTIFSENHFGSFVIKKVPLIFQLLLEFRLCHQFFSPRTSIMYANRAQTSVHLPSVHQFGETRAFCVEIIFSATVFDYGKNRNPLNRG